MTGDWHCRFCGESGHPQSHDCPKLKTMPVIKLADAFEMPRGFSWVDKGVLRCDRCRIEKELHADDFAAFIAEHQVCFADRSKAPASSTTIREQFAIQVLAGLCAYHGKPTPSSSGDLYVKCAVDLADALVRALAAK